MYSLKYANVKIPLNLALEITEFINRNKDYRSRAEVVVMAIRLFLGNARRVERFYKESEKYLKILEKEKKGST